MFKYENEDTTSEYEKEISLAANETDIFFVIFLFYNAPPPPLYFISTF